MKILVDTTVWSMYYRRKRQIENLNIAQNAELSKLIAENRAVLIGPIYQEILSGIKEPDQFLQLSRLLASFELLPIELEDFREAARLYNVCRAKGIQGSHIDFLICAIALKYNLHIFTTDTDFVKYAKYLKLSLHQV